MKKKKKKKTTKTLTHCTSYYQIFLAIFVHEDLSSKMVYINRLCLRLYCRMNLKPVPENSRQPGQMYHCQRCLGSHVVQMFCTFIFATRVVEFTGKSSDRLRLGLFLFNLALNNQDDVHQKKVWCMEKKILQIIDLSFMPWRVPLFLHRYLSDLVKLSCKQKVLQMCFSKVTLVLFHSSE